MVIDWLQTLSTVECLVFFLTANAAVLAVSVSLWHVVRLCAPGSMELDPAPPVSRSDLLMTASSIGMCTVVSAVGAWLTSHHWLMLSPTTTVRLVVDCALIILIMDLFMYVSHRAAHWQPIYRWIHEPHHEHVHTNSVSLFVLHPLEVFGFAAMLITVTAIVRPCEGAIFAFLTINLAAGTIGHAGLSGRSNPEAGSLQTVTEFSAFHSGHHLDETCNFGFYTSIWDRVLGTAKQEPVVRSGMTVAAYLHAWVGCRQPGMRR